MANEQTAITIAFRTPTLEKFCGPVARATCTATMSSSGCSTQRFGATKNSSTGTRRVAFDEASSTVAPAASSGGWQSPAGDAEPKLPPIVPRLRIGGDPTVREATTSAARRRRAPRSSRGTSSRRRSAPCRSHGRSPAARRPARGRGARRGGADRSSPPRRRRCRPDARRLLRVRRAHRARRRG